MLGRIRDPSHKSYEHGPVLGSYESTTCIFSLYSLARANSGPAKYYKMYDIGVRCANNNVPSLVAQYNLCYSMGPGPYQAWWHSTIFATVWGQDCTKLGGTVQSGQQYRSRTVPSLVIQYNPCYGMGPGLYQAWCHSTIWATVWIQDVTKLGGTVQSVIRYGTRIVPSLEAQNNL